MHPLKLCLRLSNRLLEEVPLDQPLAGVYKLFASKGHMAWAHQGLRGGLAYDLRERFYW